MGSLKCVIPGVNLKVFGRAIQSLSKIGDELYIEPLEEGFFLRSVNSSRSAYACFQFAPSFFINYVDGGDDAVDTDTEDRGFRCKLGMKSVMSIFRNISTIEKSVEKCKITLNMKEAKLVFQLYRRHGIIKTHNLSFMESETLQAVFAKDMCPNKLIAEPKLLCDAVLNFQVHQEEVTLIVRPDFVALKNYVEDEPNPSRVVHTELTLVPDEFQHFQVGVDTDITFCLKEFRAVLAFSDMTNLPMSLHFEEAGRPVTFAITSDLSFEANFVLATLADDSNDNHTTSQNQSKKQSRNQSSNKSRNNSDRKGKGRSKAVPTLSSARSMAMEEDDEDMELAMMDIQDTTLAEHNNNGRYSKTSNNGGKTINLLHCQSKQQDNDSHLGPPPDIALDRQSSQDDDDVNRERLLPSLSTTQRTSGKDGGDDLKSQRSQGHCKSVDSGEESQVVEVPKHNGRLLSLRIQSQSEEESISPILPIVGTSNDVTLTDLNNCAEEEAEESEDDDRIIGTPPNKKFRSLFFGTQTSTQSTQQSQTNTIVLAPDSDCDD